MPRSEGRHCFDGFVSVHGRYLSGVTKGPHVKNPRAIWLLFVLAVIVLCYLVPYTLLSDVDEWYGSFLFWTVATAAVIGVNAVVSADWKD